MNKADLINVVAERAEVSRRDAEAVVEKMLAVIKESLVNGEVVKLSGFGNFEKKVRAARTGTNPPIAARSKSPKGRPSSSSPPRPSKRISTSKQNPKGFNFVLEDQASSNGRFLC